MSVLFSTSLRINSLLILLNKLTKQTTGDPTILEDTCETIKSILIASNCLTADALASAEVRGRICACIDVAFDILGNTVLMDPVEILSTVKLKNWA
jgi:hypothetical protein